MNLSFKQAVHEILLCAVVFGCATVPICAANAPATDGSVEVIQSSKKIFAQVEALVKQYYPHAKMSEINQRLHIEYKVRNYRNLYSGRDELAPDQGGILADLEFKQGPYKGGEKLPKTQNQYSYMVLQLAPFFANEQQHISTKLCYAPDTSPDFVQQFSELLEDLARQQMAKGQPPEDSKPSVSVPVASPSATTTAATATATARNETTTSAFASCNTDGQFGRDVGAHYCRIAKRRNAGTNECRAASSAVAARTRETRACGCRSRVSSTSATT